MEFKYKALNQEGDVVEGKENAKDKFELANFLKKRDLVLIDADEKGGRGKIDFKNLQIFGKVSTQEKILFAKNISAMIDAGLSLSRTLNVIEKQSRNPKFKKLVSGIKEKVKDGKSLSDAIKAEGKVFDNLFVSMVRAGEESGNLSGSMMEIASQMEKNHQLIKKVRGAMIYPGVIITAMAIIGVFMMIYVVPTLTATFADIGSELPASTKFIIAVSDFFNNNLILGLVLIVVLGVSFYMTLKTDRGKQSIAFIILHSPMISVLAKETYSARTARTLGSLLKAGVSYLDAIKITNSTISNHFYSKVLEKAEKQVSMGLPVSKVFDENSKLYPPFVAEMVAVGEETGELDQMLEKVADYYENEVDQKTKNLSTIVEPVLMIIVGIVVGFFAISMISPMYSLVGEF